MLPWDGQIEQHAWPTFKTQTHLSFFFLKSSAFILFKVNRRLIHLPPATLVVIEDFGD